MIKRLILLLVICAAVFFPGLSGEFLYWDDSTHILNNANLVSGQWWKFWTDSYYALYIPVIYNLWTLVHAISPDPMAFHIFNLVLHAINGLLIWRLLKLSLPETSEAVLWLATAAFLVHPLQVESAVWISGGRDLLATGFGLLAALVLWEKEGLKAYILATLLFLLALLSKGTLAPLPVALAALAPFREKINRGRIITMGIWIVTALVVLYINKLVQQANTEAMLTPVPLIPDRIILMFDILGFYIQKILVPFPLAADYGRIPTTVMAEQWYILPASIFALTFTGILIARKFGYREIFEGWIFFGLILGPVLGIIPFMAQSQSSTADRYVYLAWFGPVMALAATANRFPKFKIAIAILVSIWAGLSFSRSKVYQNSDVFFTDMLEYNPDSFVGHTTIGVVKFQLGRIDLAEKHFREAHRIQPKMVSPVGNLAVVLWEQKRYGEIAKEIEPLWNNPDWRAANMTTKPSLSRMGRIVGRVQGMQGRNQDANRSFCLAFQLDPENQDGVQEFQALQQSTGLRCQ